MNDLVTMKYKMNTNPDMWDEHQAVAKEWSTRPVVTEEQQKQMDNFKL